MFPPMVPNSNPREAEAVADSVEEAHADAVLHGEGFGPAHHDAVGDDQAHEDRELLADVKGVGLEPAIVANCATLAHDPEEIARIDPFENDIPYDWKLKHR